ncbi:MAG: ELWxxDGT repeat protein [Kouleothrix sp.]
MLPYTHSNQRGLRACQYVALIALCVLLAGRPVYPATRLLDIPPPAGLVKDIATDSVDSTNYRSPGALRRFIPFQGGMVFTAQDNRHGLELWKSDGTTAGTMLLKDVQPGPVGSTSYEHEKVAIGQTLFFGADDGSSGFELWRSDGTPGGTFLIKDIYPGPTGSYPSQFTVFHNTLFFVASDGSPGGKALWKSDGSASGTVLVKATYDGPDMWSGVGGTVVVGEQLFFTGDDLAHGRELWVSDGTTAGTHLVKDIVPGSAESLPGSLVNVQGTLFFGTELGQLWKSDGTEVGTMMIAPVVMQSPIVMGSTLFFRGIANNTPGLWKSDGTPAGTVQIDTADPVDSAVIGNTLYYLAHTPQNGWGLRKITAQSASMEAIADFTNNDGYTPAGLMAVNSRLYVTVGTAQTGWELWTSDGTAAGTTLLKDIFPGSTSSSPHDLTNINGTLYFGAADSDDGQALWASDGTTAGTRRIISIDPSLPRSSYPTNLVAEANRLFFTADDVTHGQELWVSDGTGAGTTVLDSNPTGASYPHNLVPLNGKVYYIASSGQASPLWRSDGTPGGTQLVPLPDGNQGYTQLLERLGDRLVLLTTTMRNVGLSVLDPGTDHFQATTVFTPTFQAPKFTLLRVEEIATTPQLLFFTLWGGSGERQLWRSDGTTAGTFMLKGGSSAYLTTVGKTLFFTTYNGESALWKSDGTVAGTVLVKQIPSSNNLAAVGSALFFGADDGVHGYELWKSDGTAAGTLQVADSVPGSIGSQPLGITEYGGIAYYSAWDAAHGRELWRSDGTEAGTMLVRDITPGLVSSQPSGLVNIGGTLLFSASDGAHGYELWASQGSAATTRQVQDIAPGDTNANPLFPTLVGDRVFFNANDVAHGAELWSLPVAQLAAAQPSLVPISEAVGAPGSTFRFRATGFPALAAVEALFAGTTVVQGRTDAQGNWEFSLPVAANTRSSLYTVRVNQWAQAVAPAAAGSSWAETQVMVNSDTQLLPGPGTPGDGSKRVFIPISRR